MPGISRNPRKHFLAITIPVLWLSGCNLGSTTSAASTPPPRCNPCMIFYAGNNGLGYTGDLESQAISRGAADGVTTGILGADYLCQKEAESRAWHPNVPTGHIWRAMLADGVSRIACVNESCSPTSESDNLGWVLKANTTYTNESGGLIGTTNESAIFAFPVTNSFATGGQLWENPASTALTLESYPVLYSWTGITVNWQSSTKNCANWESPTATTVPGGVSARKFRSADNYYTSIYYSAELLSAHVSNSISCSKSNTPIVSGFSSFDKVHGLYCVEQF